ncbi:MAG: ABC transporter ATP-binding protein [Methanomassiliicoccales archaeon]
MGELIYDLQGVSLNYKEFRKISFLYKMGTVRSTSSKRGEFTALDNIDLRIERGKTIGIIGRNGSGKTTLLRVLAGIYRPDSGKIVINSDSISLLSLGAGFDSNSTGLENIYLSALLCGHPKKEIDSLVQEIIDFADIGEFINSPIKTYSSGMKIRLAFSIAIHFKPDVLLIDEALSVGDAEFQKKSTEKMNEMIMDRQRTVIIVSHSLGFLKEVCDEIIWLEKGKIVGRGDPEPVIKQYLDSIKPKK